MDHTTRTVAVLVAEPHWTVRWGMFQTAGARAVGLCWKGKASLTFPTSAVGGGKTPLSVMEKGNLTHGMCGVGEQGVGE